MSEKNEALYPQPDVRDLSPRQRPDGRWMIGLDSNSDEVVVDDINSLDNDQITNVNQQPINSFLSECVIPIGDQESDVDLTKELDNKGNSLSSGLDKKARVLPAGSFEIFGANGIVKKLNIGTPFFRYNVNSLEWAEENNGSDRKNSSEGVALNKIVPGLAGFTNLGNTCFINAGLQCLFNDCELVDYFIRFQRRRVSIPANSLSECFISLIKKVWSEDRQELILRPSEFKQSLGKIHTQFQDYRQHDCQEFLALLLGTLHDQLNMAPKRNEATNDTLNSKVKEKTRDQNVLSLLCPIVPQEVKFPSDDWPTKSGTSLSPSPSTISPIFSEVESVRSPIALDGVKSFNMNVVFRDLCSTSPPNDSNLANQPVLNPSVSFIHSESTESVMNETQSIKSNAESTSNVQSNLPNETSDSKDLINLENANTLKKVGCDSDSFNQFVRINNRKKKLNGIVSLSINKEILESIKEESGEATLKKRIKLCSKEDEERNNDEDGYEKSLSIIDANEEWRRYTACNKSIVVDVFQGQFKSTVRCSTCGHVSVTFEPFMYLPVPLPHALQRQLIIHFVSYANHSYGTQSNLLVRYLVTVNKYDKVGKIVEILRSLLKEKGGKDSYGGKITLALIKDNYICNTLEDNSMLPFTLEGDLFGFELTDHLQSFGLPEEETNCSNCSNIWNTTESFIGSILPVNNCIICFEEKSSSSLYVHHYCGCYLCGKCLELTIKYYSKVDDSFPCPKCSLPLNREAFVPLDYKSTGYKEVNPITLLVPLLFRISENWKSNSYKLISTPVLLQLPSVLNSGKLYSTVDRYVPYPCPYSLHYVDNKGQSCSRCDWDSTCTGCEIARYGDINLQKFDAIVVHFDASFSNDLNLNTNGSCGLMYTDDPSMKNARPVSSLTLDDCLKAFSSIEVLDKGNPWFCPTCRCNRIARKSLTIWKCPSTLMIYLKRFLFHEMSSVKVDEPVKFPIDSLDMSKYVQDPEGSEDNIYRLQSFVCHSGGVGSGHYTAFSRHCYEKCNEDWYYFNDKNVTQLEPNGNDERAYILFYKKIVRSNKVPSLVSLMRDKRTIINGNGCDVSGDG